MKVLLISVSVLTLTVVSCAESKRDKRTIDFVIRGFADVFGYDVLKRPSAISTTPASTAATPTAKAAHPTFFPPPLAPLPPPPARTTVSAAAQPRVTAPPLLTETVRKSFNFNINWNRNVPPTTTTAAATTMTTTAAMPTSPAAAPQTQAPVGKHNAVPLTEQNIQYLYDDIEPHRFKAINDNAYNDYEEPERQPVVAQVLLSAPKDDLYNNYQQSKDKLRESITEFWNQAPYFRDQKGYKYLTTPETNDVVPTNLESGHEEHELGDKDDVDHEHLQYNDIDEEHEMGDKEGVDHENLQYNDIDEDHQGDSADKYRTAESKETIKFPRKNATTQVETIIVTKTSCNHEKTKPNSQLKKQGDDSANVETKSAAYQNSNKFIDEVVLPQFSGVLPIGIDHLSLGEKNRIPWPIPFDTAASETKGKRTLPIDPRRRSTVNGASENYNTGKSKRTIVNDDYLRYDASSFKYEPDSYNPRFDYVAPEEKTENYEKYEKLEDAEDDADLKKAQVLMRSFGTRLNIVRSNAEITNLN